MSARLAGPLRLRSTGLGVALVVLVLTASACGGSDTEAAEQPRVTSSPSASPSATQSPTPAVTPTPSATAAPLSPFEDEAPVKAARAFFVLVARSVNAGDRSMAATAPDATPNGRKNIASVFESDFDRRARQPGPTPFTPIGVRVEGDTARLSVCMKDAGWSLDPRTRQPWEKDRVDSVLLTMTRTSGGWKFDHGVKGTAKCAGVKVPEVRF